MPPPAADPVSSALANVQAVLAADDEESWRLLQVAQQVPRAAKQAASSQAAPARKAAAAAGWAGLDPAEPLVRAAASGGASGLQLPDRGHGRSFATQESFQADLNRPLRHFLEQENYEKCMGRVLELEERAAAGLSVLLEESQKALVATREQLAAQADESFWRSRRCGLEAELELLRSLDAQERSSRTRRPGTRELPLSPARERERPGERRLAELAQEVLGAQPDAPVVPSRAAVPLADSLADIVGVCERTMEAALADPAAGRVEGIAADRRDAAARAAMSVAAGFAELLLEADRDCEALQLALSEPVVGPSAHWLKPLVASASQIGVVRPTVDALTQQLEAENELLSEALRR